MIGQLTSGERDLAGAVLIFMAIVGIAMAAVGGSEPLGIHGVMVLFYSCGLLFILMRSAFGAPPDPARFGKYYDDPIKVGVGFTLAWAIFGMFIGVWAAAQLAWPSLNFDTSWASFGRIRPAHTSARDLRVWWKRIDHDLLPRCSANLARAPRRPVFPLVRPPRLQPVLSDRCFRLFLSASPSRRNTRRRNGMPTSGWSSSGWLTSSST